MTDREEYPAIVWKHKKLYLLDQRLLPQQIDYRVCSCCDDVVASIKEMYVRGAPAIGVSAAYGVLLAAGEALKQGCDRNKLQSVLDEAITKLRLSRPTAVNLAWALDRMNRKFMDNSRKMPDQVLKILEKEAKTIQQEDLENNLLIGLNGADLIPFKAFVLTHCNAGALATAGYGTAIGVIRTAVKQGKDIHVFVGETRPLLQGARLTAFELLQDAIPATLITDNCAGYLMSIGKVDLIIVGADRIAENGDTANKIGTYQLAVLAAHHGIPFYIAAPLSTIDINIATGQDIVIEERCSEEVTHLNQQAIAPDGIMAFNPAFDVTPAGLITAIITERAVICQPNRDKIRELYKQ